MSTSRLVAAALLALLALLALTVAGCDDGTFAGSLGPTGATLVSVGDRGGGTFAGSTTTGTSAAALVGRWTHVEASGPGGGGLLTRIEWTFGSDGSASRVVTTLTPLGQAVAVDRAGGRWTGGGGIVSITLAAAPSTPSVTLRARFAVETGLTGTTLVLDGLRYQRSDGV
ncbi:hypothetical protein J421_1086 [Gemmatirosa kalamazoonensis]|uniref:Uncharacterized protein n=1 Tax=Gemmatirosa kalamazoonensis TaxID=861299 RepID=W0RGU7_9BACT|nr:hypothetical protein [Gemmatirosa kalamazoonensis]AHG88623.1 hypothetical protein J421_1086 [Gemmatirosa kalamazoonensis]